jgi:hypothetical protein
MAAEVFTVRVISEGFMVEGFTAEGFMVEAGSEAFTGAILNIFTTGVSRGFMAIAIFSVMVAFSLPVSMGTRGGGIGVIPIIGVTRITLTIPTTLIIRTTRTNQITRAHTTFRRVPPRSIVPNW